MTSSGLRQGLHQGTVDLDDIREARLRIEAGIHRTPVLTCQAWNERLGAEVFLKCENFQKGGAFKFRGALNAVLSLDDVAARRGVVTHSSGNHAAAVALAARRRNTTAYVVMPRNSPLVKRAAVTQYGGKITLCDPTLAAREATADAVRRETGATLIHPYNDPSIVAGQGTAMLELLEDAPPLDIVLAPVGGGGLLSGSLVAAKSLFPNIQVFGCEPSGADDAFRSLAAGRLIPIENPQTIADGLRTSLGELTFSIIQRLADGILLASEKSIIDALRFTMERAKLVVEPSAVVPLAVMSEHPPLFAGKRVGVILSGGNLDLDRLPWQTG